MTPWPRCWAGRRGAVKNMCTAGIPRALVRRPGPGGGARGFMRLKCRRRIAHGAGWRRNIRVARRWPTGALTFAGPLFPPPPPRPHKRPPECCNRNIPPPAAHWTSRPPHATDCRNEAFARAARDAPGGARGALFGRRAKQSSIRPNRGAADDSFQQPAGHQSADRAARQGESDRCTGGIALPAGKQRRLARAPPTRAQGCEVPAAVPPARVLLTAARALPPPQFLRLSFHDCAGPGGCNGCINL